MFEIFDKEQIKKIIKNGDKHAVETILPKLSDEEFGKLMEFILMMLKEEEEREMILDIKEKGTE